jgi:hypothetical protein
MRGVWVLRLLSTFEVGLLGNIFEIRNLKGGPKNTPVC